MSSLVVSVSPKQEKFITSYVKSGRAPNRAAVVRRALDVLEKEEAIAAVLGAEREIAEGKGLKKIPKPKKLSAGLRAALRDVEAGRVSGPFDTVEEFMSHLLQKK